MILVVVLVVISLLTMAALTFAELMFVERQAAELSYRQTQALESAQSGIEQARMLLVGTADEQSQSGGTYDNPALFRGMLINDNELANIPRNRFSLSRSSPSAFFLPVTSWFIPGPHSLPVERIEIIA